MSARCNLANICPEPCPSNPRYQIAVTMEIYLHTFWSGVVYRLSLQEARGRGRDRADCRLWLMEALVMLLTGG